MFTRRHIVSAASLKLWDRGHTAKTMAADANQLQDLREFLLAGDEDSARRLTENLNPSSVVNVENVDFTKLPKDILGTSLIPISRDLLGLRNRLKRENTF